MVKFTSFQIVMVAWFVLGILGYSVTASNANTCANALVGALASNQCTPWVAVHDLSIASMWIAGSLFAISVIIEIMNRQRQPRD